jgi:uncharacterized protein
MSKIWIDLDNSPHVPLFRPIIRVLEEQGHTCVLTARNCFQVKPLLDLFNLKSSIIGRHYGKNKLMKVLGVTIRAIQLLPMALRERPAIALSHGSRSQLVAARLLGISTVLMADYEHAAWLPGFSPDWIIVPEVVLPAIGKKPRRGVLTYRGIKEDAYVPDFQPDAAILGTLGIDQGSILVTIRPPATEAHYHNPESEGLFSAVIDHFAKQQDVQMVCMPRNEKQADLVRDTWPELLDNRRLIIPKQALGGLNLIWFSDLVVSGGGTMNREAAALCVPVCSIFRGRLGAVDQHLSDVGRLRLLRTPSDIHELVPAKRQRPGALGQTARPALSDMVQSIESVLDIVPSLAKPPAAVPRVH